MDINKIFSKVNDKVNTFIDNKKEQIDAYNRFIEGSKVFELSNIINVDEDNINEGNVYQYKDMCVYINIEDAKRIASLIDIDETVIYISFVRQKKDDKDFIITLTDKKILVNDKEKYLIYRYDDIKGLYQVNKSLMSQIINFNDIILEIDLNQSDLDIFYNLIMNSNYRNSYALELKKYLCGIIPIYQKINKIGSGISIDNNKNIVFHDRRSNNYLCRCEDISLCELLEDNTPVIKSGMTATGFGIGAAKQECGTMKLRITLINKQVIEITILEPKVFNATYGHTDTTYLKYFAFGKEIIEKIDELKK